jgi:hypothetical protein
VFGIEEVLLRLRDIRKKLDFMSGTIYTIEGIARNIYTRVKEVPDKLDEILTLLKSGPTEPNLKSFYFSKVQVNELDGVLVTIIEGRVERIQMNEFQQVSASYAAEKKDGSPAKVENPRLETDHPELMTGTIDEAAQRITLKPVKGAVQEDTAIAVKLIADADLGEGVEDIEVVGSVLLTPGNAVKLSLNFEEPVDLEA